jgi:hypothetical protein
MDSIGVGVHGGIPSFSEVLSPGVLFRAVIAITKRAIVPASIRLKAVGQIVMSIASSPVSRRAPSIENRNPKDGGLLSVMPPELFQRLFAPFNSSGSGSDALIGGLSLGALSLQASASPITGAGQ